VIAHWRRADRPQRDYDRVAACGASWTRGVIYHRKTHLVTCPKCRELIEAAQVAEDVRKGLR